MSNFVHLHVHSHYSLLDGLAKIPDLVAKAKEYNMPALALTDHGVMYGALEFYRECMAQGIQPIIGLEAYVAPRLLSNKEPGKDTKYSHLLLLARNEAGYKNLIQLTTLAHLEGFYYKPRIDLEVLKKYSQGLIATTACLKGKVPSLLLANEYQAGREAALEYQKIFGVGDFYLELEHHPEIPQQIAVNQLMIKLSQETHIPLVLTKDSHYLNPDDQEAQDAMVCIQTGKIVDDKKRLDMSNFDMSFTSAESMIKYAADLGVPEAAANTVELSKKCYLKLDLTSWHFPTFDVPEGKNSADYLTELTFAGLKKREGKITPEDKRRLDYELDIIISKQYDHYFLIVADFMNWARSQDIIATTRGSASGSLVSYALGITSVNPLRFNLPFERFLTKKRPTPPDIDCDIQDDRRDQVIDYVRQKYGADKVANIGTFGTMQARAAVRDITRVLGLAYGLGDKISKMIPIGPQGSHITIDKAKKINPELRQFYQTDGQAKKILDLAERIEGCVRHISVHAAGVVIAPKKLTEYLPLQREPKGEQIITQYDMRSIDPNVEHQTVGLLKADFLGIRNLSILGLAVKIVERTKNKAINLDKLPWDDKKTFKLLSDGKTMGVFQLSSSGMTKNLKDLRPDNIYDIMAMVALYRPGPMEIIPEYIKRKHDPSSVTYPHPLLKNILERTFGLLIYQDDVMLTAMELAGYNAEEADQFRKAMGKKIKELMAKQKDKFIKGCINNSINEIKAREIWGYIEPFAGYGFNKAHSASYAVVAYQTAYMKANFPAEFMAALMTCESGNTDKIAEAVIECEKMGIKVLAPDVNQSLPDFTYISDRQIRFGLAAIKNLGHDIVATIVEERKKNGPYHSLEDFLTRVISKNLNKKSLEALTKAGALDALAERNQILVNINKLLSFIKSHEHQRNTGQFSLFGRTSAANGSRLTLEPAEPAEEKFKLLWEKELLGLYVSSHPFKSLAAHFADSTAKISDILNNQFLAGSLVSVAGIISKIHKIFTKQNELMMFVTLEDITGSLEIIVFPKLLQKNSSPWQEDKFIFATGRLSDKDDLPKILAESVSEIDPDNPAAIIKKNINLNQANRRRALEITILINHKNFNASLHAKLKDIFNAHLGQNRVYLTVSQNSHQRTIATNYYIVWNDSIKSELEELIGQNSIITTPVPAERIDISN